MNYRANSPLEIRIHLPIDIREVDIREVLERRKVLRKVFMRVEQRKVSGREKNEAAIKLLEKLRERLFFGDASARRCAAFKLSWMQEDGLDVLKEILFRNDVPITARYAAGYGMRSMNGRMKKMALEVLTEGLNHPNRGVREVCSHTLRLLTDKAGGIAPSRAETRTRPRKTLSGAGKFTIRDIPRKGRSVSHLRRVQRGPVLVQPGVGVR